MAQTGQDRQCKFDPSMGLSHSWTEYFKIVHALCFPWTPRFYQSKQLIQLSQDGSLCILRGKRL